MLHVLGQLLSGLVYVLYVGALGLVGLVLLLVAVAIAVGVLDQRRDLRRQRAALLHLLAQRAEREGAHEGPYR